MGDLATYLSNWNDWIVLPGLAICSFVAFFKLRKRSLLVTGTGILFVILGRSLIAMFPPSQELLFPTQMQWVGFGFFSIGILVAIAGSVWFIGKDYHAKPQRI